MKENHGENSKKILKAPRSKKSPFLISTISPYILLSKLKIISMFSYKIDSKLR